MKKINKLLMGIGTVTAIVTPVTALSMSTDVDSNIIVVPEQKLFDNIYPKQLKLKQTWKNEKDEVRLVYENKNEIQHLDNYFDFFRMEGYIAPPEIEKDFKVTVLGASVQVYKPDSSSFDENPRIIVDVEYMKTGKHWGFSMDSTATYWDGGSEYNLVSRYVYNLATFMSSRIQEQGKDSADYKYAYKWFQQAYENMLPVFFNNEQNYFKSMKDLILSVQDKGQSLKSQMNELNIEKTMSTYQLFNQQNILDFKKDLDTKKVDIDKYTFKFNTRTTGVIDPHDFLNSKELYKQKLLSDLKANKLDIDPSLIDTYNDIDIKIKKVIVIPEFELRGDWDINYRAEISGSLLGSPLLIKQQEVEQYDKSSETYVQDLYTHLIKSGEKLGIQTDRSKLYPLQNTFKNYDEYKDSMTQKIMPQLFKDATFTLDKDFDISKINNDLTLDLTIQNTITHNPNRKFEIHLTDIALGFEYEAVLNKDITISGTQLLLK